MWIELTLSEIGLMSPKYTNKGWSSKQWNDFSKNKKQK